jgi:hypothetical protein
MLSLARSRKMIAESLGNVRDDEAHGIAELNVREILKFPRA